ncbi:hypothetical protein [Pseudomonas phage LUZ7]|uniref:Uncharacterized protein n=1 Tax=Pseudomonas phage LUZ7 TaxID=655097 RepID=C8ZKK8_9CAUD|nr:hypothetical protein PP-LUZ7_gp109 [Pseudomonas phage LUZ7]CAZ66250.1 hypothetical protein [Pseudomonas phage LUZ7]
MKNISTETLAHTCAYLALLQKKYVRERQYSQRSDLADEILPILLELKARRFDPATWREIHDAANRTY